MPGSRSPCSCLIRRVAAAATSAAAAASAVVAVVAAVAAVVLATVIALVAGAPARGADGDAGTDDVQARVARDVAAGRPIVVHVLVALCDNEHQGIVPVPRALGVGDDPRSNLYWGARFGLRTFFTRDAGWTSLPTVKPADPRILERLLLRADVPRADGTAHVYVVADAWNGAEIRATIGAFLAVAAGADVEDVRSGTGSGAVALPAGGAAHLVAFVGHNGLMDFPAPDRAAAPRRTSAGASAVLACASRAYFLERLQDAGSRPVLLTNGLMAPEAYTLDAVIRAFAQGGTAANIRDAAARRYDAYQKCGARAARNLFWSAPP